MSKEDKSFDLEDRLIDFDSLIDENNQLISIFVTSINTARKNKPKTL
jgi:hypothetical protein